MSWIEQHWLHLLFMVGYLAAPGFFNEALEYQSLTLSDFLGRRYDSLVLRKTD